VGGALYITGPPRGARVIATVDARTLKGWLRDGAEIALLDVREAGQFGESHLFLAVPLPFSRLELEIARLVPRKATRVVVCDDGECGVAQRAAARLGELGYSNLSVLEGGTRAWGAAGHELYAGVNVPSKAFGELVEHFYGTPRLAPSEVAAMREAGEDFVIVDGRPLAEFRKMSIPGALCCPNGELAYRIAEIAPDPRTRIVVNCAGRTRSIVGAQTLIGLGIPNPVFALENGTQGWNLANLPLDHGAARRYPGIPPSRDLSVPRSRAQTLAARHGVRFVEDGEAQRLLDDATRTTYVCDVRTPDEFAAGTLAGAASTPGGQLLQATDQWIAVRGARILLVDGEGIRAPVVASWLVQMGHDACVVARGVSSGVRVPPIVPVPLPEVPAMPAAELARAIAAGEASVVDLRSSMAYRASHIPGSSWSIRPRLDRLALPPAKPVVLVADDPGVAAIAARDVALAGFASVAALEGGFAAWRSEGRPVEATPDEPPDAECVDFLFFVHERHEGNKDAARRYLAWETQLVSQLDEDELACYRLAR